MYQLEKIKNEIAKGINGALKKNIVSAADLIYPPKPEFGDLSLPCYHLAKQAGKTATEMAEWLVGKVKADEVASVKAIGPFVNFTLNKTSLAREAVSDILKKNSAYGLNKSGKGKKVMVEFSNANTHKEYHVGHLRNIAFGDAVTRIIAANGFKAMPVSYINDFGIHTAKTLWALEKFYKDKIPPTPFVKGGESKGYFLGKVYVRACDELEKNPDAKNEAADIMKKIESRSGAYYKLWQKTRKWSIEGMAKIYKELDVKFDHIFYESEVIDKGLDMVADLYKKEILTKSQGAIIADLQKYDLGVLVFIRSDGTALYPVADLPLAEEKFRKYKIDRSVYVVDVRQSLYFKQLFKLLELLGYKKDMVHLGYEFVKLPEGMMSSRTGKVVTYEDLRSEAMKRAIAETKERHKNWNEKKLTEVAGKLVNGALKFEMVKVGADKVITFDMEQALRFDGFTAAYLQYTCARINSIIKKAKKRESKIAKDFKLENAQEQQLIMKLAKYPEAVEQAGKNYSPDELAKFIFDLAREFNDYYHAVPVLKAKPDERQARLALCSAVKQVIANGLGLLGIETMEEM